MSPRGRPKGSKNKPRAISAISTISAGGPIIPRASALPIAAKCASSLVPSSAPHNPQSGAASLGTAVHAALEVVCNGGSPDLDAIAREHQCSPEELAEPYAAGVKIWADIGEMIGGFDKLETEVRLNTPEHTGRADLVMICGDTAHLVDWKSGYMRTDVVWQLGAYARGAAHVYGAKRVVAYAAWLRFGDVERYEFSADDMDQLGRSLAAIVAAAGKQYAAGEHCGYCPRRLECPTHRAYVEHAVTGLTETKGGEMTLDRLGEAYLKSLEVKKMIAELDSVITERLQAGEAIPLPGGKRLEFRPARIRGLRTEAAWKVLVGMGLDKGAMANVATLSAGRAASELAAKTGTPVAECRKKMFEALESAGAIEETTILRKTQVKGRGQ